jgi:drug/metabolite transporter (DMT)-like permease
MTAPTPRRDRIALGVGLIVLSTFLTASQDAIFKHASASLTLWQVYVLRSSFLIPALLVVASFWGGWAAMRQSLHRWPLLRALCFVVMYFSMYAAIPLVSLSTIAAGLYTAPLFIAALSAPLLGEPVRARGWLAIAVGFAGVLVILRPGSDAFSWLALLPVIGGLAYAFASIITRSRLRETPPPALALALGFVLLVIGVVGSAAIVLWAPAPHTVSFLPFLLGPWGAVDLAVLGFIAALAALMVANGLVLPAAYQSAPSVIIATFDYCYLIFATLLGILFFDEVPDLQTIVGMLMIAGAGLLIGSGGSSARILPSEPIAEPVLDAESVRN